MWASREWGLETELLQAIDRRVGHDSSRDRFTPSPHALLLVAGCIDLCPGLRASLSFPSPCGGSPAEHRGHIDLTLLTETYTRNKKIRPRASSLCTCAASIPPNTPRPKQIFNNRGRPNACSGRHGYVQRLQSLDALPYQHVDGRGTMHNTCGAVTVHGH